MSDRDIFSALSALEEDMVQARTPMPSRLEVTNEVFRYLRNVYRADDESRRGRPVKFVGLDIVVEDDVPPPGWRFVWPEGHEPKPVLVIRSTNLDLPEGRLGYRIGEDLLVMDAEGEALPAQDPTGRRLKEVNIGDPEVSERIRAILDEAMTDWRSHPYSMFSHEVWGRIMEPGRLTEKEHRRLYEGTWPSEGEP